jgi:hypothetical protein
MEYHRWELRNYLERANNTALFNIGTDQWAYVGMEMELFPTRFKVIKIRRLVRVSSWEAHSLFKCKYGTKLRIGF